ncbi:MAG: hypothetical protein A2338_05060 [Bacteroidetes bacterium RIFOXYB12_FULL_41_6]|nr:MAG: hypothetical protein A2338_05060 [Bacteroidetes bacterium RIFOXYB12_FULL_41_6]
MVLVNGCKKENTNTQVKQTVVDDGSEAITAHILAFKERMAYYHENPNLKGSEQLLQIDSTILDWEATINLTYCHSYLDLGEMVVFDTILDIPLVEGDSITMLKASEKYFDNILESIQDKYFMAEFTEKRLVSVDLEPVNGGDSLSISLMVGNPNLNVDPLYDWYWGKKEGVCVSHQYFGEKDAAIVLAGEVRDYFYTAPPENCRWIFTNIITYTDDNTTPVLNPDDEPFYYPGTNIEIDNYCDYMIYYAHEDILPGLTEDVRCIESLTEKGFYKQSYLSITQQHINNSPIYLEGHMKLQSCAYFGLEIHDGDGHYLKHELTTHLGRRFAACSISLEDIAQY